MLLIYNILDYEYLQSVLVPYYMEAGTEITLTILGTVIRDINYNPMNTCQHTLTYLGKKNLPEKKTKNKGKDIGAYFWYKMGNNGSYISIYTPQFLEENLYD